MEYKKIDTLFTQARIDNHMIKQANFDMIGQMKRDMANKLTDKAIHKYTNNVLLKFSFSEEEMESGKLEYNGHIIFSDSHKRLVAKMEVFENELR